MPTRSTFRKSSNTCSARVCLLFLRGQVPTDVSEIVEVEDLVLQIPNCEVGIAHQVDDELNVRVVVFGKRLKLEQVADSHHREWLLDLHRQFGLLVGIDRMPRFTTVHARNDPGALSHV